MKDKVSIQKMDFPSRKSLRDTAEGSAALLAVLATRKSAASEGR